MEGLRKRDKLIKAVIVITLLALIATSFLPFFTL